MKIRDIQHEGFVELFDIRIVLDDADDRGLSKVSVSELQSGEVWARGEWNGQCLNMDDPDAIDMELYLDVEEAVSQMAA